MFGNIGFLELALIALILLILFGAKRIPVLFGSIGQGVRELKRSFQSDDAASEADRMDRSTPSREASRDT